MAHFFDPYTGTTLSSIEVIAEGQAQIALWGGGPAPEYDDLDVTFDPARPGSITPPDGLNIGGHNRIFWINGPAAGGSLRALTADGNDYAQRVSVRKVAGYYRTVPPAVLQDHAKSECWAAALWAWLQVTPGRPKMSKQELLDKYSDMEDDGLSEQTLTTQIVRDFGMGWWASRTKSVGYIDLLPSHLIGRLQRSHLYFIYKSGVQSSHALCVYGVGSRYQSGDIAKGNKEPTISSMDPWYGRAYHRPFKQFYGRPLFIAWAS